MGFAAVAIFLPAPALKPVSAPNLATNPAAYEGQFVYFTGPLAPEKPLEDEAFNISERTALLKRKVTVFVALPGERSPGWTENKLFVPREMKAKGYGFLKDGLWQARDLRIGSIPLSEEMTGTFIPELQARTLTVDDYDRLSPKRKRQFFLSESRYFKTGSPKEPAIGDQRVSYESAGAPVVSAIGTVQNGVLKPYVDGDFHAGFIRAGAVPPEAMLAGLATPDDESAVLAPRLAALLVAVAAGLAGAFLLRGEHMHPLDFIRKLTLLARRSASGPRASSQSDASLEERLQPAKTPPARSRALSEATEMEPLLKPINQTAEHVALTALTPHKPQTADRSPPLSPPLPAHETPSEPAAKSKSPPAQTPSFSQPEVKPNTTLNAPPVLKESLAPPTPATAKKPTTSGLKNAGAARVKLTLSGAPKDEARRYPAAQTAAEKL